MLPTLEKQDDIILIENVSLIFFKRRPQVGDIVSVRNPYKPGFLLIKRIVATENEKVVFTRNKRQEEIIIPKNHIWIEGDNKENSKDSRHIGPISVNLLTGRVIFRVWPLS